MARVLPYSPVITQPDGLMLWTWLEIIASIAIAAYLWMRFDDMRKAAAEESASTKPGSAAVRPVEAEAAD
jgi:hypothetical protein